MSVSRSHSHGFTLIELIMFIIIVSVGLVGILSVLNIAVFHSADPMVRKQMLAIAEGLLEEVEAMPFTYCDPNDASAASATSATIGAGGCATTLEQMGPEGETRGGATPFDNVNDYFTAGGLAVTTDISGTQNLPVGYAARIDVTAEGLNGIVSTNAPATMEALRIAVTVTHGGESLVLEGYRTRYAPNTIP